MRAHIVYPLPFDNWATFEQDVYRFIYTFKQYGPDCDYVLHLVGAWGEPDDDLKKHFWGTKAVWHLYQGDGADLGAHHLVAGRIGPDGYLIGLSTRCYFHRSGWGKRLVEARLKHGPGMFGTGDFQHRPHLRTCGYGMDAGYWNSYREPMNRAHTMELESGEGCLTEFVSHHKGAIRQVTWDNERTLEDCRNPEEKGIFRRSSQTAVLVWDRHTKIFEQASDEEKARLSALSDPPCQTH